MPIIHHVTADMFEFEHAVDYQVNPCNTKGAGGKGLSLEFRNRTPSGFEEYVKACKSNELHMGAVQIVENTGQSWGMINAPTKRHWLDSSDRNDIIRTLEALRTVLLTDKYKYASMGMPMLGTGLGRASYDEVYPLMIDYLGDLEATTILSMAPDRTDMRPTHLLIVGPPDPRLSDDGKKTVDETIAKVMTRWGKELKDYTGIITGGMPGIDTYIGGGTFNENIEDSYVYRMTGKNPLVSKPNKVRNGVGAFLRHGNLLCEFADDVILFKPIGHNNNRLVAMQMWLKEDRQRRAALGRPPRRVAVFGEHEMVTTSENLIV